MTSKVSTGQRGTRRPKTHLCLDSIVCLKLSYAAPGHHRSSFAVLFILQIKYVRPSWRQTAASTPTKLYSARLPSTNFSPAISRCLLARSHCLSDLERIVNTCLRPKVCSNVRGQHSESGHRYDALIMCLVLSTCCCKLASIMHVRKVNLPSIMPELQ